MNLYKIVILLIVSYLIGAVPTGYLVARLAGVTDIREHGSGNIGATNVARVLGAKFFPLIFVIDSVKAYVPLIFAAYVGVSVPVQCLMAVSLCIGNMCSVFLHGSGGKGVATGVGIFAALTPVSLVPMTAIFLLVLAATKTVGISSVAAVSALPFAVWYMTAPTCVQLLSVVIAAAIIWRHTDNIRKYFYL